MRMEKIAKWPEVSDAWNFDFDDDESDGADVAAFEYADSPSRGEDSNMVSQERDYDFNNSSRVRSPRERVHSELDSNGPGTGFDDFDDEDDVDSYEIDAPNNYSVSKASSNDFSEVEDIGVSDNNFRGHWRDTPPSNNKHSKLKRPKALSQALRMMSWILTLMKSFQFIPTGSLVMLLILDIQVEVEVQRVCPED